MATVKILTDEELSPEAAEVFADIRATRGSDFVNNVWRALANNPPLLKSTWEKVRDAMAPREGGLDPMTKELVYLSKGGQRLRLLRSFPHRSRPGEGHDGCAIRGIS